MINNSPTVYTTNDERTTITYETVFQGYVERRNNDALLSTEYYIPLNLEQIKKACTDAWMCRQLGYAALCAMGLSLKLINTVTSSSSTSSSNVMNTNNSSSSSTSSMSTVMNTSTLTTLDRIAFNTDIPLNTSVVPLLRSFITDPDQEVDGSSIATFLRNKGFRISSLRFDIQPYLWDATIEEITVPSKQGLFYRRKSVVRTLKSFISDTNTVLTRDVLLQKLLSEGFRDYTTVDQLRPYLTKALLEEFTDNNLGSCFRQKCMSRTLKSFVTDSHALVRADDLATHLRNEGFTVSNIQKDIQPHLKSAFVEEVMDNRRGLCYRRKYLGRTLESYFREGNQTITASNLAFRLRNDGFVINSLLQDIQQYLDSIGIEEVWRGNVLAYRSKTIPELLRELVTDYHTVVTASVLSQQLREKGYTFNLSVKKFPNIYMMRMSKKLWMID